jgi:hypothetical protein
MSRSLVLASALLALLLPPALARADIIYCQSPFWTAVNASSPYDSEVADDASVQFEGELVDRVTLWAVEWLAAWQDPDSVVVSFYDGICGPALAPVVRHAIPWAEAEVYFFGTFGSMIAYEATVDLPELVEIGPATSIGASLVVPWGPVQPYAGFLLANYEDPAGCGEFYLDNVSIGAPRWTLGSVVTGFRADLAFCLWSGSTAAAEPNVEPSSWGRLKSGYR